MSKKIIIPIVVILFLIIGGGFFWWQNQKDVRELNKNLPEGVRVVKSLIGREYKVVNKIDGYEIKIPEELGGLKEVKYYKEEGEEQITGLSIEGQENSFGIISHVLKQSDMGLENWIKEQFEKFKLSEKIKITKSTIGKFEIAQVKAEQYFGDYSWYFFKENQKIYEITGVSEEFLQDIISNGKW